MRPAGSAREIREVCGLQPAILGRSASRSSSRPLWDAQYNALLLGTLSDRLSVTSRSLASVSDRKNHQKCSEKTSIHEYVFRRISCCHLLVNKILHKYTNTHIVHVKNTRISELQFYERKLGTEAHFGCEVGHAVHAPPPFTGWNKFSSRGSSQSDYNKQHMCRIMQ